MSETTKQPLPDDINIKQALMPWGDDWPVSLDALALLVYGIRMIPLHGSRGHSLYALVDAADYPMVGGDRWRLGKNGYAVRNQLKSKKRGGGQVLMHRVIMGDPEGIEVDHRNLLKLDNLRTNLRQATRVQNNANHPIHRQNKLGIKGVKRTPIGRYAARIRIQGQEKHLGTFDTPEEAAQAYDYAALKAYGRFARTNNKEG